jgi:hypothetical protein
MLASELLDELIALLLNALLLLSILLLTSLLLDVEEA